MQVSDAILDACLSQDPDSKVCPLSHARAYTSVQTCTCLVYQQRKLAPTREARRLRFMRSRHFRQSAAAASRRSARFRCADARRPRACTVCRIVFLVVTGAAGLQCHCCRRQHRVNHPVCTACMTRIEIFSCPCYRQALLLASRHFLGGMQLPRAQRDPDIRWLQLLRLRSAQAEPALARAGRVRDGHQDGHGDGARRDHDQGQSGLRGHRSQGVQGDRLRQRGRGP